MHVARDLGYDFTSGMAFAFILAGAPFLTTQLGKERYTAWSRWNTWGLA